jgi:hypothetical protein
MLKLDDKREKYMKTQYIAMITGIILLLLVGSAQASYTIDPKSKSVSVNDVTDISFDVIVYNTWGDVLLDIIPFAYTNPYVMNVSYSQSLPDELIEYINIIPNEAVIYPNSSGKFTIHISLPDQPETYGHTWEFVIRFNNTDFYSLNKGSTYIDVPVRLYLPATKPIPAAVTPFYVYPFIIIFSLIMLGGIIIYLKKRSVPLALRDHESSISEWSGMQFMPDEMHPQKKAISASPVNENIPIVNEPPKKLTRTPVIKEEKNVLNSRDGVIPYRKPQ